jgi:hypothetical protein
LAGRFQALRVTITFETPDGFIVAAGLPALLVALLERLRARFRNRMVLLARAAADADGAARSSVLMLKAREVKASLIEMSMLPSHASSISPGNASQLVYLLASLLSAKARFAASTHN